MKAVAVQLLKVEATLLLEEKEIDVLEHVFSYDLASVIITHVTKKYNLVELMAVFQPLRGELSRLVATASNARKKLSLPSE